MTLDSTDDECCLYLINALRQIFPNLTIQSGAEEPFYAAPTGSVNAVLYFRDNYPRSLLHEMSHYCLAGDRRRALDDFDYWYSPCGRTEEEQLKFESVEARPQGLEKVICEVVGLKFSPSLDDFSGRPPSDQFLVDLEKAYQEMCSEPPPTAKKILSGLKNHIDRHNTA
jgi:elongation factor P hydroxylase